MRVALAAILALSPLPAAAGTVLATRALGTLGYTYGSAVMPPAASQDPADLPIYRFTFDVAGPGTLTTTLYYGWELRGERIQICDPDDPDACWEIVDNWAPYSGVQLTQFAINGPGQSGAAQTLPDDFELLYYAPTYGYDYISHFYVIRQKAFLSSAGPYSADVGGFAVKNASNFAYEFGFTPDVPEPAVWAAMLVGFGVVGSRLRARRGLAPAA